MNTPYAAWKTIAFQGALGAYGHMAAVACAPKATVVPCASFEEAFTKAESGEVDGAVIPIDNNSMGRIADFHLLFPKSELHIIGEHYQPVVHCLLGLDEASVGDVRDVHSQLPALLQCTETLKKMGLAAIPAADTAGSAKLVLEWNDPTKAALASELAGEVYGLKVLKKGMNDHPNNTTRFVVLGRDNVIPPESALAKTSLIFQTKSIPAALYKALGGFATNGVNLTKIESYLLDGKFTVAQFYIEAEAHVASCGMKRALDELAFFTRMIKIVGCYEMGAH